MIRPYEGGVGRVWAVWPGGCAAGGFTGRLAKLYWLSMVGNEENTVGLVETRTIRVVEQDNPLLLDCGKKLGPIDVAYETYGQLNQAGDNAILICHALSGNAHVAGYHNAADEKPGWWESMVGPGKGIDTNKYFVICSNFLGGCSGTTGPSCINPETGRPYGLDFPIITIADMVRVQKLLLDALGIKHLLAVLGGSIGGMQVLQWAIAYPDMMAAAIPIATTTHLGAQSIAFDAVGRNAILADANFADGQYHEKGVPAQGLAIARMIGHITYLSEEGMRQKFGRQLRSADRYSYEFNSEFAVETYLDHQGQSFVERFDANSYLYITKASDYFDLPRDYGSLEEAFASVKARFLVVSFSSDWLFTPVQSEAMVDALVANGKDVSYCNIASSYGHDAFLLENPDAWRVSVELPGGDAQAGRKDWLHRELLRVEAAADALRAGPSHPRRLRADRVADRAGQYGPRRRLWRRRAAREADRRQENPGQRGGAG